MTGYMKIKIDETKQGAGCGGARDRWWAVARHHRMQNSEIMEKQAHAAADALRAERATPPPPHHPTPPTAHTHSTGRTEHIS